MINLSSIMSLTNNGNDDDDDDDHDENENLWFENIKINLWFTCLNNCACMHVCLCVHAFMLV